MTRKINGQMGSFTENGRYLETLWKGALIISQICSLEITDKGSLGDDTRRQSPSVSFGIFAGRTLVYLEARKSNRAILHLLM